MVAQSGRAAFSRRRAASAASAGTGRSAPLVRRRYLARGLSAGAALALWACGSVPVQRGAGGRDRALDTDDPDSAGGGAGSEVVMLALANVGKPYRWGGDSPEEGFDCSGLVAHVYEDAVGMRLPRTSRQMSERGASIKQRQLAAGDLVFFNTSRRPFSHVGIYIGQGRFVHAPSTGSLVRVESLSNRYWASRFDGARRVLALE